MKKDWEHYLEEETSREYYRALIEYVNQEYAHGTVYPPKEQIFAAFELTGYKETNVVILGQDPYHGEYQAHGLSFSVADERAKFPPSLRNMFCELESDLGVVRTNRDLTDWAKQGVLLLNTVLTVRAGQAASHRNKGWERFTDAVIRLLNDRGDPVIFVLWGADAGKKRRLLTNERHRIISSAHPSPLSAYGGFFGSRPYSRINGILGELRKTEILW